MRKTTAAIEILDQYYDQIETTSKPCVPFTLSMAKKIKLWHSKVGGNPYLPLNAELPRNSKTGQPLTLLAQINFAEMPHLPDFPETGILQFFADAYDNTFGCTFNIHLTAENAEGFKIVYYPEVIENNEQLQQDFSVYDNAKGDFIFPFEKGDEYRIKFNPIVQQTATVNDFEFSQLLPELSDLMWEGDDEDLGQALWEEYLAQFADESNCRHQLAGYAEFTQRDPRNPNDESADLMLLMQLDSDWRPRVRKPKVELMWGDMGIANFFIRREDLLNRDFGQTRFNWDCH